MKFSHLAAILTSIAVSLPRPETPTVFQEDFCGTHNLSNAIFQYGFPVIARDIDMSRHLDFIGTLGFVAVIAGLRSIIEGGLCWFGLPCSTWIFMSRGSTKRTRLRPRGQRRFKKVREANKMARRVVYACRYVEAKGAYWVIEQPISSLVVLYPPMRSLLRRAGVRQIHVPLGQFGATSMKLVCLLCV